LISEWRERAAITAESWSDVDLTFTQLRALFVLGRQPLRISDLAKALGMSLASASALSDRLVRLDLVTRLPDPGDRRSVVLRLTASATRLLRRIDRAQTSEMTRAIKLMTAAERKAFATTLHAFLRITPRTGAPAQRNGRGA